MCADGRGVRMSAAAGVPPLPRLISVRGWTEEVNPAYIMFLEEMRATGVDVIDVFPDHFGARTFGEWADRAVDEIIRLHRDRDPLHLIGYCGGGSVLHVAVRHLERRGVRPDYLGFIDVRGGNPRDRLRLGLDSLFRVRWMQRIRFQMVRLTPPDREPLGSVLRSVLRRSIRSTRELRERGWRSRKRVSPAIQAQGALAANWEFDSITTPAHAYNCQVSVDRYWPGDPSLGRAEVLRGGFIIRPIGGTHETCISPPHSAELIERIAADRSAASGTQRISDATG